MKKIDHLFIFIICVLILLFEVIAYSEILDHPYMVVLIIFLVSVGAFNLAFVFIKK